MCLKACYVTALLVAVVVICQVSKVCASGDLTVRYYTSVTLTCDNVSLNVSEYMSQVKFYWILPNGDLIWENSNPSPNGMTLSQRGYALNITKVNDYAFGYYHCIVMFKDGTLKTVRRGLNVHGADFSELHEQYRHNAMVGGIAAAVTVVLVGVACIIWTCRYNHEDRRKDLYSMSTKEYDDTLYPVTSYDNEAAVMEEKVAPPVYQDEAKQGVMEARL